MEKVSRKAFLKRTGLLGFGLISGMAGLSACGSGENEQQNNTISTPPEPSGSSSSSSTTPSSSAESVPEVDCSKYNENLSEAAQELRNNLGYVSKSPKPQQHCQNCQFWQPDKYPDACGGCQLFPDGAVNPAGWCQSWSPKQA